MAIFELFSKRKQLTEKSGSHDVYQYNFLPYKLKVQMIHILATAIGLYRKKNFRGEKPQVNEIWGEIHRILCREYGVFELSEKGGNAFEKCEHFLFDASLERALDLIELSCRMIDFVIRRMTEYERANCNISQDPDDAIEEINGRFRENRVGYKYVNGKILRLDSAFIHSESIIPAIHLLHDLSFSGAEEEFMKAHEHYRKGENENAIQWALKALESTMKAICDYKKWPYSQNSTAKDLIKICFDKGLIPKWLESKFSALRATLESGLPAVRNKVPGAGHGKGGTPVKIPDYMAAYAINLAATNIRLLFEAYKESEKSI